ncbi:unnamed protein product [Boreogadus saida]
METLYILNAVVRSGQPDLDSSKKPEGTVVYSHASNQSCPATRQIAGGTSQGNMAPGHRTRTDPRGLPEPKDRPWTSGPGDQREPASVTQATVLKAVAKRPLGDQKEAKRRPWTPEPSARRQLGRSPPIRRPLEKVLSEGGPLGSEPSAKQERCRSDKWLPEA